MSKEPRKKEPRKKEPITRHISPGELDIQVVERPVVPVAKLEHSHVCFGTAEGVRVFYYRTIADALPACSWTVPGTNPER